MLNEMRDSLRITPEYQCIHKDRSRKKSNSARMLHQGSSHA